MKKTVQLHMIVPTLHVANNFASQVQPERKIVHVKLVTFWHLMAIHAMTLMNVNSQIILAHKPVTTQLEALCEFY
jgi:hypothetical protein